MATERLKVILEMAAQQYKREAREAATATGKIQGNVSKLGTTSGRTRDSVNNLGRSLGLAFGAAGVVRGLKAAVDRAEQMNSAYAITEQVIKQTGGAANVTAEEIKELSKQQSILTGVDKAFVTEGNNVLLTFKNIRNEVGEGNNIFERTSDLMLDISATMGTDAKSGALQLGKALNDPISQMGALSRAGLTFTAQQKDQIKTLVESGDLLTAQKIILSELESQLGGTAAASADASDKMSNAFKEIGEAVGTGLLPFLETAAIELTRIVGLTDDLDRLAAITGQDRKSAELLAGALHQLGLEYEFADRSGGKASERTREFTDEAQDLIDLAGLSVTELEKLRGGLDFLVETMGLNADQAEILAQILDEKLNSELARLEHIGADQVLRGKLNPALTETADILTTDLGPGLDETRDRIRRGEMTWQQWGGVVEDTTGLIEGNMDALQAFFDLVDGRMDSIRNLAEHEDLVAEATKLTTEALKKYGPESDEYIEALDNQSQALQDQREAQRRLVEQGGQTRAEFILQQTELGLTAEEAIALADEYDNLFVDRNATHTITNKIVNVTTNKQGGGGGAQVDSKLAGGGPFETGRLYEVGEQNKPELAFIPGNRGAMFSHNDVQKLIAAFSTGGGSTTKQGPTFQFYGDINGVDEVMGAVQRAGGMVAMVDLAEVNPR